MVLAKLNPCCIVLFVFFVTHSFTQNPTTPHLPEVFVGKCYSRNPTGTNCTDVWRRFSSAAMLDNRDVNSSFYVPFFDVADFSTAKSSILFWSGSMAFALAVSSNDQRFVTVEETSTGYILNGLSWCGLPNSDPPSFDYTSPCYYPTNSTYYGQQGVWAEASTMFAQGASGDIVVLLQPASIGGNPSVYQAYRNTSIFAQIELPAMRTSHVDSITVLLLKNSTLAPDEMCGKGSLLVLEDAIYKQFGFASKCLDDPKLIYDVLCPPHTSSAQCLAATLVYTDAVTKDPPTYLVWSIVATAAAGILFILVLFLALLVRVSRRGYASIKN